MVNYIKDEMCGAGILHSLTFEAHILHPFESCYCLYDSFMFCHLSSNL